MNLDKIITFLFNPKGRMSRAEWWIVFGLIITISIIYNIIYFVILFMDVIYGGFLLRNDTDNINLFSFILISFSIVFLIFSIAVSIISSIKRYHDRGKSGWWSLLILIPFVNIFAIFELGFLKGNYGPNEYGEDRVEALFNEYKAEVEKMKQNQN